MPNVTEKVEREGGQVNIKLILFVAPLTVEREKVTKVNDDYSIGRTKKSGLLGSGMAH